MDFISYWADSLETLMVILSGFHLENLIELLLGMLRDSFSELWNYFFLPQNKVFFWLLLNDILSTRNIWRSKNMNLDNYNCVLYHNALEETLDHLFLNCDFARNCWRRGALQRSAWFSSLHECNNSNMLDHLDIHISRNDLIFKWCLKGMEICMASFLRELSILV
jgi:hypothetical protein